MANVGTLQTSHIVEDSDECQENVALEDTTTAGTPKVRVGCVDNFPSTNLNEESKPLSGTCTFSTPAPTSSSREVEAKSQLFGLQSALIPNLRILNISNKSPSVKHGRSPRLNHPYFTCNQTTACQKPAAGSGLSDLSPSYIGGLLGDRNASVCWWYNETLPQVSLLDDTCDSSMQSSWAPASTDPNANVVNTPAGENPRCWLDGRFSPDITLLEVTQDSELSPVGDISSAETTQGNHLKINTPSVKPRGENVIQLSRLDINWSEESSLFANSTDTLTSWSLQSDVCAGENIIKVSLTQDVSMGSENSRSSTVQSGQDKMSQTSTEDKLGIDPVNVTRDISSSDLSAASQLSSTDMQVTTSSTIEVHGEPVGAENANLTTSCDMEMTSKVEQRKSEMVESARNTSTVSQSSINGTINGNAATGMPHSLNNKDVAHETKEQENFLGTNNATESPLNINQSSSADKSGSSCDVKNGTFDQYSAQTSCENTGLQETGLQNTFDMKLSSELNTMTLSEIASGEGLQDTLDKSSPSKVCSTTTMPKDCNSEVHAAESPKAEWTSTSTGPKVKTADLREITFESTGSLVVKASSEAEHHDSNGRLQPDLPVVDGPSDGLDNHSIITNNGNANAFNFDDTLDLRMDYPVTSTPMANCKIDILCNEQDDGKIIGAQKKMELDCPSKPALPVQSTVPSNIVCDRKTFLRQPAAASSLPAFKAASHLKSKPASTEGRGHRLEPSVAGLAMTRSRTLALKNTSAPEPAQGISGTARSYNLRATTAGPKHPTSGLLRPQTTGIPSGIQRAAPSLRPPLTRSIQPASSANDKLCGPTAINPLVKYPQVKKHLLNRVESLQTSKRKKMDAAVTVRTAEASASCDAASKARVLKPPAAIHRSLLPKPPSHGCAKCIEQEEEIKNLKEGRAKLEEEMNKLKEELKKYKP